jgi:cell filamentation protein
MNGRSILENDEAGEWKTQKVAPAGMLKPGIYNLYSAAPANEKKPYTGPVIHVSKEIVVQAIQGGLVQFPRSAFDKVPELGVQKTIQLADKRATVAEPEAQTRSIRR